MVELPDVDIDLKDRDTVARLFQFTPACVLNPERTELVRHKTGVYPQAVPIDEQTGLCAFPYKHAENLGYYKVDLIPNHVYDGVESPAHLRELLAQPIQWMWFLDERFYEPSPIDESLTHLGGHYDLVQQYPPESIDDIAVLLALIRPGKRQMIGQSMTRIRETIWIQDAQYTFKRAHAISFAVLVGLHARLIAARLVELG